MQTFDIVVAVDERLGIGKNGQLPWKLSKDMAYFKRVTSEVRDSSKRNAVIMGRKTYESIPPRFRPLDNRLNIVLSRQPHLNVPEEVFVCDSLHKALRAAAESQVESIFVIGGADVFAQSLEHPACKILHLTQIEHDFDCDTFFPDYKHLFVPGDDEAQEKISENGIEYQFRKFIHRSKLKAGRANCVSTP